MCIITGVGITGTLVGTKTPVDDEIPVTELCTELPGIPPGKEVGYVPLPRIDIDSSFSPCPEVP
ncbi:MAG: hypothetical protein RTU30_15370 [Candidatus Thorarchaeota archaeon]